MGTALLLGIPAGYVKTAKSVIERNPTSFNSWSIKYIPSSGKEAEILDGMLDRAYEFADAQDLHILGFSAQRDRQDRISRLKPYFRTVWFDHGLLKFLGSPDPSPFSKQLERTLLDELEWSARVKPSDLTSPLLLPECTFEARLKHRDLWRHANAYGDIQNIIGAEKAVKGFRHTYYRKLDFRGFSAYKWVDNRGKLFQNGQEKHGIAPFPRTWKYSYKIEPGFHFDVTHLHDREFALIDVHGKCIHAKAGNHINVDPHGYVI